MTQESITVLGGAQRAGLLGPYGRLYTAGQSREIDRLTASGLAEGELMARAGQAAFDCARALYPRARRWWIFAGPGNNGGDGYVLARLAHAAGLAVSVLAINDPARLPPDAAAARTSALAAGVVEQAYSGGPLPAPDMGGVAEYRSDLIIDALLGSGAERELGGAMSDAVARINDHGSRVFSIDIPTGIDADAGRVLGVAVRASATISFICHKRGLFTGAALDYRGDYYFNDLSVNYKSIKKIPTNTYIFLPENFSNFLPPRKKNSHKGKNGHVLIIAGGPAMPGAALLAGEAAYRAGAGLVTLATHPDHAAAISAARPELIVYGVREAREIKPLLAAADVIAIGPGLGQSAWAQGLLAAVLECNAPKIIDADALNLLAAEPWQRGDWILTPHPGEAARLLKTDTATTIQRDRISAAQALHEAYGGVVVLKGAGTIIASDAIAGQGASTRLDVITSGNPMLATAGTGDVLTGLVAGIKAQGLNLADAARLGAWIHGRAADILADGGERGFLASDLFAVLPGLINEAGDGG